MKKLTYPIVLILILLIGCSEDGTIKVKNNTDSYLEVTIESYYKYLNRGESVSKSWKLSNSIFNEEEKDVSVSGQGLYKFHFDGDYRVCPGKTKKLTIYADAGAICIANHSTRTIVSVYLSPSSDTDWGSDDLSGYIYSGEYYYWTATPGYWDIKVVDSGGYYGTSSDNYISIDNTTVFGYYGKNKADKNNSIKLSYKKNGNSNKKDRKVSPKSTENSEYNIKEVNRILP